MTFAACRPAVEWNGQPATGAEVGYAAFMEGRLQLHWNVSRPSDSDAWALFAW